MVGQLVVLSYLPQETVAFYTSYKPSLIEIVAGAGVIAYGLFAFSLGVRYFGIVNHQTCTTHHYESEAPTPETIPEAVPGD